MPGRQHEAVAVGPVGRASRRSACTRVNSTCASGASAIGVPGWPEFAFCTASIARPRITLMPRCSRSVTATSSSTASLAASRDTRLAALAPHRARSVARGARLSRSAARRGGRSSQEKTAMLAVKPWRKLRPPTGPISPAQNAAGGRDRAEQLGDDAGVVVGHAEEVLAAPVAREHQRGRRPCSPAEQRAEVLVGRGGVAHVELHRLPDLDPIADRDARRSPGRRRARCARGSRRGRSRRGARRRRRRGAGPAGAAPDPRRRRRVGELAQPVERGRPASSSTKFRSAPVTTNGLPIGRQPCDTTVCSLDARRGTRRRRRRSTTGRRGRAGCRPGRAAADAIPPIDRQVRAVLVRAGAGSRRPGTRTGRRAGAASERRPRSSSSPRASRRRRRRRASARPARRDGREPRVGEPRREQRERPARPRPPGRRR